jgi:DNA polymerase III sliding clamp (beta) subunit (PCNA family)
MTIHKQVLYLSNAKDLLSGDETLAQQALDNIIYNMKYELDILKKFNSNKLAFKHY